jgi:hydrogenase-4 component B
MIDTATLLLCAVVLAAISGVPGLFFPRRSQRGPQITAVIAALGGSFGIVGVIGALAAPGFEILSLPTPLPHARFVLSCDALSAFFLAPIFVVFLAGSIYGMEYWNAREYPGSGKRLRFFYGLLSASLATLVLARNSVTLLVGWEGMAVSAFFVVATEDEREDVRDAGWMYLAASHAATLVLVAMFAILFAASGSYDLVGLTANQITPTVASIVFVLALLGFGLKAGIMPLHFWLPSAHAMAPSHVSAVMSGVLIKMGIYGLVRITWMLPHAPAWWGALVLGLGIVTAVLGIIYALAQHDLKRLLAYSSVDNIGVIAIGLGLALLGRAYASPLWITLGLAGALMHVWNHALFKSLLFLGAGSVLHVSHTRQLDALGGLAKKMPWTAAAFLIGATAASGLPPMNGFVSEFLIYMGLFHTLGLEKNQPALPIVAIAAPALALMGGVAVACFVKAFGVVFLGTPRQPLERPAHDPGWAMRFPMLGLSIACVALGIFPRVAVPVLDQVCHAWARGALGPVDLIDKAAPLVYLNGALLALFVALVAGFSLLQQRIQMDSLTWADTWGCGYSAPTPRIQYTGSSLVQFLVTLFDWSLKPVQTRPKIQSLFPGPESFASYVPELILDRVLIPLFDISSRAFQWTRLMQQGNVHIYLAYIVVTIVLLLLFWH